MSDRHTPGSCVDVVVPVFGHCALVRRCLESVLRYRSSYLGHVLVVDDASPDRETADYLDGVARAGDIELIRHSSNLGFVAAVNTGMSASQRDVLLLNSDAEVHGNWLERMTRCAHAAPDVGTVTPFSNNATICSYPFPPWRRRLPGMSLAELDDLFSRVNAGEQADLPTGVGFCLLIRRECLTDVGPFDEQRFGRGYGEETDFCQRAWRGGWRSVICADTFVYHEFRGTFGRQGRQRARAAEWVLRSTYPGYADSVREFILRDRLGGFRRQVDAARLARSLGQPMYLATERAIEQAVRLAIRLRA